MLFNDIYHIFIDENVIEGQISCSETGCDNELEYNWLLMFCLYMNMEIWSWMSFL
jgi:hypothetical protein